MHSYPCLYRHGTDYTDRLRQFKRTFAALMHSYPRLHRHGTDDTDRLRQFKRTWALYAPIRVVFFLCLTILVHLHEARFSSGAQSEFVARRGTSGLTSCLLATCPPMV
jgi:hypothetical protein